MGQETDFERLVEIVTRNLREQQCPRSQKVGCLGECDDCWKIERIDFIIGRNRNDELLGMTVSQLFFKEFAQEKLLMLANKKREIEKADLEYYHTQRFAGVDFQDDIEIQEIDDINRQGPAGKGLLHLAVEKQDREEIRELVIDGANPYLKDNSGFTPIDIAKIEGMTDIVQLFKDLGFE
jgi:ankyrin repeat protein